MNLNPPDGSPRFSVALPRVSAGDRDATAILSRKVKLSIYASVEWLRASVTAVQPHLFRTFTIAGQVIADWIGPTTGTARTPAELLQAPKPR